VYTTNRRIGVRQIVPEIFPTAFKAGREALAYRDFRLREMNGR
jgi:hypothetical protein